MGWKIALPDGLERGRVTARREKGGVGGAGRVDEGIRDDRMD